MDIHPEELAKLFKILGDANRLRIVFAIEHGESSVSEIIERTGLSQTLVSFHLKALRDADLVKTDRQGAFIFYRLTKTTLLDLIGKFQEHLSETIKETSEIVSSHFNPDWNSQIELDCVRLSVCQSVCVSQQMSTTTKKSRLL